MKKQFFIQIISEDIFKKEYSATITFTEDNWYVAWVDDLPGVNTQGKTFKELIENLQDAIKEMHNFLYEEKPANEHNYDD